MAGKNIKKQRQQINATPKSDDIPPKKKLSYPALELENHLQK